MMIPFDRTVCACSECTACCTTRPGYLIPSDVLPIMNTFPPSTDVTTKLRASKGPIVGRNGKLFRIGTITPQVKADGSCVFLTADKKCGIHGVSPFGCAYLDMHLSETEGAKRSAWGLRQIVGDTAYDHLRQTLIRFGGEAEPFVGNPLIERV